MKRHSPGSPVKQNETSDSDLDDFQPLKLNIKKSKMPKTEKSIDFAHCHEHDKTNSDDSETAYSSRETGRQNKSASRCNKITSGPLRRSGRKKKDKTQTDPKETHETNDVIVRNTTQSLRLSDTKKQSKKGKGNMLNKEAKEPLDIKMHKDVTKNDNSIDLVISILDESDDEFKADSSSKLNVKPFEIFSPKKHVIKNKPDANKTKVKKRTKVKQTCKKTVTDSDTVQISNENENRAEEIKSQLNITSKQSRLKKSTESQTTVNVPKIHDNYCPFCQMPFCTLGIQSPNWHSMECMDLPLLSNEECEHGIKCDSTIPNHYRRYKHTVLANYRATQETNLKLMELCKTRDSPQVKNDKNRLADVTDNISSMPCDVSKQKIILKSLEKELSQEIDGDSSACLLNNSSASNSGFDSNLTESDEDIFNVEIPETPNFFSYQSNSHKCSQLIGPAQNLEATIKSGCGGFIINKLNEDDDDEVVNSKHGGKGNLSSPVQVSKDTIDLSLDEDCVIASTSNRNCLTKVDLSFKHEPIVPYPHMRKQTSLFSYFQTKYQKNRGQVAKMEMDKIVSPRSFPDLKKSKSDPWGSLKLQDRSKSNTSSGPTGTDRSAAIQSSVDVQQTSNENYNKNGRRKYSCPFYKKIPETGLTVDAFSYGKIPDCTAYILTHFHYDHYNGLTKKFKQPIYCSKITGNLVESKLKVECEYINRLPMNIPCMVEGVELILREANHCPGAVIIFMRLPSGRLIVHTGDYRAHPTMEEYPELRDNKISDLYLDTTYCNPDYAFPYQSDVINFAIKIAIKTMNDNPKTCIVCGTYTIGKERVFKAIAKAINSKVCVKKDKKSILACLEDDELNAMVTLDPNQASVHVLPMNLLKFNSLSEYLEKQKQFTSILVFEPTGWTHSNKVISLDHVQPKYSRNAITHYGIPYSEHSSFLELKRFVQFLKPKRILPTVNNANPASRQKMKELFADWLKEAENKSPVNPQQTKSSLINWTN